MNKLTIAVLTILFCCTALAPMDVQAAKKTAPCCGKPIDSRK